MTLNSRASPRSEIAALVGIGALLCLGVVTVITATLHLSALAYGALASMLAVGVLLALLLQRERPQGHWLRHSGPVLTTLFALIAFLSYLAENAPLEYIFLGATAAAGVPTLLLGLRFDNGAGHQAKTR